MLMNRSLKRKPTLPLRRLVTYCRTALSPPAAVCSSRKDLRPATDSLESELTLAMTSEKFFDDIWMSVSRDCRYRMSEYNTKKETC